MLGKSEHKAIGGNQINKNIKKYNCHFYKLVQWL